MKTHFSFIDSFSISFRFIFSIAEFFTLYEFKEWFTIKPTQRTLPYTLKIQIQNLSKFLMPMGATVQVCSKKYKFWSGKL